VVSVGDKSVFSNSRRLWVPRFVGRDVGRVIVADPDPSVFAMVRQLTAPDLWEVRYAGTPDEVLRGLRAGPVKLAVVELPMLDDSPMLSEELMARVRRGLSVVVTTDYHSEPNERRARIIGPVYYAPKPLHVGVLSRVLDGALAQVV
jgi:DNA-binding NtrC family response regulator